jgi:hypothetical protein
MTDYTLARAADALRRSRHGSSQRATTTRRRVLALAAARRRKSRWVVTFLVPLAAVVGLSAAWAAATGRLPRTHLAFTGPAAPVVVGVPVRRPTPAPPAPASSGGSSAETARAQAPDAPAVSTDSIAATSPPQSGPAAATGGLPARAVGAHAVASVDRDAALYAVAHRAHFVERDPAAALRAWDAYLAALPEGRFALEARYNRALSLVRLGRVDEARGALQPFASGRYGGYRAREARELLDALAH